jgi:hypothetical protein
MPRTGAAPGELLWGEAPRRQPIAPLIVMAVILLLVASPVAMAGNGSTSNPIKLMRQVADSTYELTGLMGDSNGSLAKIDENSSKLIDLQQNMGGIAQETGGMEAKTKQLNLKLGEVGTAIGGSKDKLQSVNGKLVETAGGMGKLRTNVAGSATSTKAIVSEFGLIDTAIGSMNTSLNSAITQMGASGPLTAAFANNKTRIAIAGGDTKKFGVPNLAAGVRVMSVVLPMINVMQHGGPLAARKDSHHASNPIVGTALKIQVPDGVNVVAMVKPFNPATGYGLPDENFFVHNRIDGF